VFALAGNKLETGLRPLLRRFVFSPGGFLIPRALRRMARFSDHLDRIEARLPHRIGSVLTVAFFCVIGLYGMQAGGHARTATQQIVSGLGFAIETVRVSGNRRTSDIDIIETIALDGATSLLSLDVDAARTAIEALPWVRSASVRKIYPQTVEIVLDEREAFAIWQHGSKLSLIEADGAVIGPFVASEFDNLPLVVGFGAESSAADLVAQLSQWPRLETELMAAIRVADRRWNLKFATGLIAKLPEENLDRALADLDALVRDHDVLARDMESVDLRLADRLTVRLTESAMVQREKALQERDKALKDAARRNNAGHRT